VQLPLIFQGIQIVYRQDRAGKSEGETVTYGFNERNDIKSVVEYIHSHFPFISNLGLWGRSMGAASVILFLSTH